MIRTILVAVDDSDGSRRAADFAHDLALQTGAHLTLLLCIEPPGMVPFGALDSFLMAPQQPSPERVDRTRVLMAEQLKALPPERVDTRVETGPAAEVICTTAEAISADLIVLGARGTSSLGRWLLGSVSERVLRHAGRPVTVVH